MNIAENFVKLGEMYADLSRKYFGWIDTYVDLDNMVLTTSYMRADRYRLYFAEDGNHRSVRILGVEIQYFSIPTITVHVDEFDDLQSIYEQAWEDFHKISKNMEGFEENEAKNLYEQKIILYQNNIEKLKEEAAERGVRIRTFKELEPVEPNDNPGTPLQGGISE